VHAKDLAGLTRSSSKPLRGIVGVETIQRVSQAIVVEQLSRESSPSYVFGWLVLNVRGYHRHVAIAKAQSIQDHRCHCRSHVHMLAIAWIVCVSPGRSTTLLADPCDDPHVVQTFMDVALCCVHLASSSMLDPPLPHSAVH
jgi:hypothetical protein